MAFVYNASIDATSIDDDYVSASLNIVEVPATQLVENGQFIRLQNDSYFFWIDHRGIARRIRNQNRI